MSGTRDAARLLVLAAIIAAVWLLAAAQPVAAPTASPRWTGGIDVPLVGTPGRP